MNFLFKYYQFNYYFYFSVSLINSGGFNLHVEKTEIRDLLILKPQVFEDERGYFFESHNKLRMEYFGLDLDFVQDNVSFSKNGTIRGLHYQVGEFAQGKLVYVLKGKVLDIALDIRIGSPTFGKHLAVELFCKCIVQLLRNRGCTDCTSLKGARVVFVGSRVIQKYLVHGWHTDKLIDLIFFNKPKDFLGIEPPHQHPVPIFKPG